MRNGIKVAIDAAGRIVVPKWIREQAGLRAGIPLEIRLRDGRVEIAPAPREVRIVKRGELRVAEPRERGEPLPSETVRRTRDAVRTDRKPR